MKTPWQTVGRRSRGSQIRSLGVVIAAAMLLLGSAPSARSASGVRLKDKPQATVSEFRAAWHSNMVAVEMLLNGTNSTSLISSSNLYYALLGAGTGISYQFTPTNVIITSSGEVSTAQLLNASNVVRSASQPLDTALTSLSGLNAATGFAVFTASETFSVRGLVSSGDGVLITDGDGVAANPTFGVVTNIITTLTEDQTPATNDLILTVDISSAGKKRVALGNAPVSGPAQSALTVVSNGAVTFSMQVSNDLAAVELVRNAAVSNGVIAYELIRNAAVSNALVTLSSNNVRVVAGTGGGSVDTAGSAGVQTYTVNFPAGGTGSLTTLRTNAGVAGTNLISLLLTNAAVASPVEAQVSSNGSAATISYSVKNLSGTGNILASNGPVVNDMTITTGLDLVGATTVFDANSPAQFGSLAIFDGKLTINSNMIIPWEATLASSVIQATTGPRQMMTLGANTNVTFAPLAGSDGTNSVPVLVAVKQNATGGFTFTANGRQLPINTATGAVTDVIMYFHDGRTNFVADLQSDFGTISAGQVLKFHNGGLLTNSTDLRLGVYRTIYLDAAAGVSNLTSGHTISGATFTTLELGAPSNHMADAYIFNDGATTTNAIQFKLAMPLEWDGGTIKAKFYWTTTNAIASQTNVWSMDAVAISNDDPIAAAWGTEQIIRDAVTEANDLLLTDATPAITIGGTPAAGDMVWLRVKRLGNHTDDAMSAAQSRLLGVWIQYLESTTEPASW